MKHTDTKTLRSALRDWHPTHDEAMDLLASLASSFEHNQTALGDKCRAVVVDQISEAFGAIENDQIEQQAEQAWADNQRRAA